MTYPYAGDGTYPATIELLEDGDVWNGVTAVEGMIEKVIDRTSHLKGDADEGVWGQITCVNTPLCTLTANKGVASAAYFSAVVLLVTFDEPFADLLYVATGSASQASFAKTLNVTFEPVTTTTMKVRVFEPDAPATPIDLGDPGIQPTSKVTINFQVRGARP
jgi:hypothetical protein